MECIVRLANVFPVVTSATLTALRLVLYYGIDSSSDDAVAKWCPYRHNVQEVMMVYDYSKISVV